MKLIRKVGATSQILQIFIANNNVTTGAGLTGLAFNSAGLTAYYHRDTDTTATAISLVTMTVGTFTSSGFKEIDATNMPGWYQFCPPNAALASGAASVGFHLKGATNMADLPIEVDLDSQVDVYLWNGTAVATPATAGVPDVNVKNFNNQTAQTDANNLPKVDTEDWKGTAVSAPATAGIPDINVKNIVNVAAAIDANNLLKVDTEDWKGTAVAAPTTPGVPDVNVLTLAAAALTAIGTAVWAAGSRTLTSFGTLVADVAAAVWAAATRTLTAFGFTVTTDISALVNTDLDAKISSRLASASYTTPPTTAQNADGLLNRNLGAGSNGGHTVQDALRTMRNRVVVAAGVVTVYAEDGVTVAWTAPITVDPAAEPITAVTPT